MGKVEYRYLTFVFALISFVGTSLLVFAPLGLWLLYEKTDLWLFKLLAVMWIVGNGLEQTRRFLLSARRVYDE